MKIQIYEDRNTGMHTLVAAEDIEEKAYLPGWFHYSKVVPKVATMERQEGSFELPIREEVWGLSNTPLLFQRNRTFNPANPYNPTYGEVANGGTFDPVRVKEYIEDTLRKSILGHN